MKKKIYISGKIKGNKQWVEQFNDAEFRLKNEWIVFNPVTIIKKFKLPYPNPYDEKNYKYILANDLMILCECDAIYMLKNWLSSTGANIEYQFAKAIGLEIIFEGCNND